MSSLGVNIAILNENRILLTRREDFEVWCLPGGAVDERESLAQAAVREAHEETGLEVELLRLVGVYSQPNWHEYGSHIVLFAARPAGGQICPQSSEVLEIAYFAQCELPELILFGQQRRIKDAFAGVVGAVWSQEDEWPFDRHLSRQELYAMRDRSGLSRQDFYRKYFAHLNVDQDRLEVPPYKING